MLPRLCWLIIVPNHRIRQRISYLLFRIFVANQLLRDKRTSKFPFEISNLNTFFFIIQQTRRHTYQKPVTVPRKQCRTLSFLAGKVPSLVQASPRTLKDRKYAGLAPAQTKRVLIFDVCLSRTTPKHLVTAKNYPNDSLTLSTKQFPLICSASILNKNVVNDVSKIKLLMLIKRK